MPIKSDRRTSTDAQLVYKVIHIYIVQHEPMHGAKNVQHILLTFFFFAFPGYSGTGTEESTTSMYQFSLT